MKLTEYKKQNIQLKKYLVCVTTIYGGVYNEHHTKEEAMLDYLNWIELGYNDIIIKEIIS